MCHFTYSGPKSEHVKHSTLPKCTVVMARKIMCQYYSSFWLGFKSHFPNRICQNLIRIEAVRLVTEFSMLRSGFNHKTEHTISVMEHSVTGTSSCQCTSSSSRQYSSAKSPYFIMHLLPTLQKLQNRHHC